jgi:predicted acylesterase/phospholipase RssA/CRP-like cAMP-binding protein
MPEPHESRHQPIDTPLLQALRAALTAAGTRRVLLAGEVLCREGDDSSEAFVVIEGGIDAHVLGHSGSMTVARHGARSIVGEVTTLIGGHRTASLVASTDSVVSVIDREGLQQAFNDHQSAAMSILLAARERTDRSRVAALLSEELEAEDGDVVAAIADRVTWTNLLAGEVLFHRGDNAEAAYLVVSGRLAITDRNGTDSGSIDVGRGAIVGEFGLLEGRGRSATVTAVRDTSLARLAATDFSALASGHPSLAMGLVRRVLDRSGSDVAGTSSTRSFALAVTADISNDTHDQIVSTMVHTLDECGPTAHLTPASVDTSLRQPGIANTERGGFGEVRLAELFHHAETDHDHLVIDAGTGVQGPTNQNWIDRALHQADQVVIVSSPDPDEAEAAIIRRLIDATPERIPTWIARLHPADCTRPQHSRELRERFGVDEVHHLRHTSQPELGRLARLAAGRGVGLVLSGGGARGNAHIGVYRNLVELGIPVDRVIGSSMGSIVAGGIGQQLDPDKLLKDMSQGSSKLLDYTIPVVALVRGDAIFASLNRQFSGWEIDDLWVPFSCLSTNLTTAAAHIHRSGPVATAIRTSTAIPGVLPPVPHDGHLLADGGVLDNLPVGVFADDPSIDVIIASDVAPPSGPVARIDYGVSVSGWSIIRSRVVPKSVRRIATSTRRRITRSEQTTAPDTNASDYPTLSATLMRALMIGSAHSRDAHLASGAIDLYLELDLSDIGLLDFEQVTLAADRGAEQSRAAIVAWLDTRHGTPWKRA